MSFLDRHRQYRIVLDSLDDNSEIQLLEIGAADKTLQQLLPAEITYHSLDFGADNNPALKNNKYTYLFDLNSGRLPIEDDSYDVVVCFETLEHVMYPDKVLDEINRVVKDDGLIFLSLPNEYNFIQRIYHLLGIKTACDEPFQVVSKSLHIHRPRVKDILNLFSRHFEIVEVRYLWQSSKFPSWIDSIINKLAQICPSLFARLVAVKAIKRNPKSILSIQDLIAR